MRTSSATLCVTAMLFAFAVAADVPSPSTATPGKINVDSVLVTLIEQAEVAAREPGVLADVPVVEGQLVTEGTILAQITDTEARIAQQKAKLELDNAERAAENDVKIRYAKKSLELAKAEARRAAEAGEKYKKAVSQTELDTLRLAAEKAALELEQAEHDRQTAMTTRDLKANELDFASLNVERRKIVAPLTGVVVQVKRRKGEWVQAGETVVRVVRMDRLRAEAFLPARSVGSDLNGAAVTLVVDLEGRSKVEFPGKLVFVSPEVNPVNEQVRVWAEIENTDMLLRPGLRASLSIDKTDRPDRAAAKR